MQACAFQISCQPPQRLRPQPSAPHSPAHGLASAVGLTSRPRAALDAGVVPSHLRRWLALPRNAGKARRRRVADVPYGEGGFGQLADPSVTYLPPRTASGFSGAVSPPVVMPTSLPHTGPCVGPHEDEKEKAESAMDRAGDSGVYTLYKRRYWGCLALVVFNIVCASASHPTFALLHARLLTST